MTLVSGTLPFLCNGCGRDGTALKSENDALRSFLSLLLDQPTPMLSFLAIPVNQFLFLTAMKFSTPSNAALLYSTTPAIVLLITYFSGRERLTKKKTLGVLIALCGAVQYGAFPISAATMIIGTVMYLPIGIINTVRFDYAGKRKF